MPASPCVRCSRTDSSPRNFLLTCKGCSRCWHHRCHIPEVSDAELISRIRAFNNGDVKNGINAWMCKKCTKRTDKDKTRARAETEEQVPVHVPESTPISVSSAESVAPDRGRAKEKGKEKEYGSDWREEPSESSVEVVAQRFVGKPPEGAGSVGGGKRKAKSASKQKAVPSEKPSASSSKDQDDGNQQASQPVVTRSFLVEKQQARSPPEPSPSPSPPPPPRPVSSRVPEVRIRQEEEEIVLLPTPPPIHVSPTTDFRRSPSFADIEDLYGTPAPPPPVTPILSDGTPAREKTATPSQRQPQQIQIPEDDLVPKWMRKYVEEMGEPDAWQRSQERKEQREMEGGRRPRKAPAKSLAALGRYNEFHFTTELFRAQNAKVAS